LEAVQKSAWRQYAPVGVLLLVQWAYLLLGLKLDTVWGMATAGAAARAFVGPGAISYPAFYEFLPLTFSFVETATYVLGGMIAIPLVIARVGGASTSAGGPWGAVRRAWIPTFIALAGSAAAGYLWQTVVIRFLHPILEAVGGGPLSPALATWLISALVAYALTTLILYVPVLAVQDRLGAGVALRRGIGEGLRSFGSTYAMVLLLSFPALAIQLATQLGATIITLRTRPENIVFFLMTYAFFSSLATYWVWSMATREYQGTEAGS
jgi:hypothetical protein